MEQMRKNLLVGALFVAALLTLIGYLLLPACGLGGWFGLFRVQACPQAEWTETAPTNQADTRQVVLEERIAELQRQLDEISCLPATETVQLEPEAIEPPAPRPDLMEADPPDIDEAKWRDEEIDLLEGCWNLDSDYSVRDVVTGVVSGVAEWHMCFDDQGVGRQSMILESGVQCASGVSARFQSEKLILMDSTDVDCDDRSYIHQRETTCEPAPDGTADCTSLSLERQVRARVRLRR